MRRWLSDYVDGDLSSRRRRRVERHAAECPDCGPVLRGITHVRRVLLAIGGGPREQPTVVPLVLERMQREGILAGSADSWDGAT